MKIINLLSSLLLFLLLTACGTAYHPVGDYGGIPHGGYDSTRINANTVIVSFDGNIFTSAQTVNNDVLYRAAKITIEDGYDYFVVVSTSTCNMNIHIQTRDTLQPTQQPPKLFNSYYQKTQYQSYQTSTSTINRCAPTNGDPHKSQIVIKMFQGKIPAGLPRAYDPTDVIAHSGN